ncbi:hypothetical protein V6N13_075442 [Hibiscus sabdariffa]|uniref:Growth-regulating factor n=1 Tax=Hibiscus sabdariffa TaxID=183260 RepID=A0ABR2UBI1_9ROSI
MDFGVVGLEGFVCSEATTGFISHGSDPDHNLYGSQFFKQGRFCNNEDEPRSSKLLKNDEFSGSEPSMFQHLQRHTLLRSNASMTILFDAQEERQMLSFSAPKSDALSVDRSSKNLAFPHFHPTGYNNGGLNGANMHGEYKGPFTLCQWMELEHQALIYKHIVANVPIPSNLLIHIRQSLVSADISSFSGGLLRPNTLGWRAFQLGFSNHTDPEPGRCRRTDGKKWRCSRDAVAYQKYCERHMNRGCNRSRKPVEGHSIAATATSTTKLMPNVLSSSELEVRPVGGSGKPNSLTTAWQQSENLQPGGESNLSAADPLNRLILNKDTVSDKMPCTAPGFFLISPKGDLKSKENPFLITKQLISYEENLRNGFGVVSLDSLNPFHKSFGPSQDLTSQKTESQHPLRRFIDDWSESQSDCSAISWPKLDVRSYRTQLSVSIPMAASDFMSTTSSPNNRNLTPSPLQLSCEFDPIHIGLGVGDVTYESNRRQVNWTTVSWETSMGEALHSSNSSTMRARTIVLDSDRLRQGSYKRQPSVLFQIAVPEAVREQRITKTRKGVTHCNDVLGSALVESSSLPALSPLELPTSP